MRLSEALKKWNRTLLEMDLGMLAWGILCELAGIWFMEKKLLFSLALWLGVGMAMLAALHMYRSLDRALDQGEAASKLIFRDYLIRYVWIVAVLLIIIMTKALNPLVVFAGLMGLKISALIQPFTHKCCNRFFQEEDPTPCPETEGDPASQES